MSRLRVKPCVFGRGAVPSQASTLVLRNSPSRNPMHRCFALLLFTLTTWGLASPVRAEVRRLAVVIGSDVGGGERPVLHFAQTDAEKFASVLVELRRVRAVRCLSRQGAHDGDRARGPDGSRRRVAIWRREDAGHRIVLVVYFWGTPTERTSNWAESSSRLPSFGGFSRLGRRCPARDHRQL